MANPIAENRQGLIGRPVDRVDGRLKVTGRAPYAHEVREGGPALHGFIVEATIARGRVAAIDATRAERAPGVRLVYTHLNAPAQGVYGTPADSDDDFGKARPFLATPEIRHYGDPVAFVVADTIETARAAASLIQVTYETAPAEVEFAEHLDAAITPDKAGPGMKPDSEVGDFAAAFAAAPVKIDQRWTTPSQNHHPIEPHAATAYWDGDRLVVHCAAQLLTSPRACLANTLQMPEDKVRVFSRFIGGGFGGKLPTYADAVLAALASRQLGRPVRVAMTRQQIVHNTTNRSATSQRVRLGANRDGRLVAFGHDATVHCARFEAFVEAAAASGRSLYAAPNRRTTHRLVKLDLPVSHAMRAPGEAAGLMPIEEAMDELAVKLGIDPIDLRVINEPAEDPERKVPFSTRQLVPCLRAGAELFGWQNRRDQPGVVTDGRWRVGMGVASAIRANYLRPAQGRVRLDADGIVTARSGMTDIGTGSYTVLAQIVAETMGVPLSRVRIILGDSDLPPTPGSGGSFGAASAGGALYDACLNLRASLAALAVGDQRSPLHGTSPDRVIFADQAIAADGRAERLDALVARVAPQGVQADGRIAPGADYERFSQYAYGAHFAEVGVDIDTGEVRLRRMLGVFAAGRLLNEKTARSQALGGMIWGVGTALHEENEVDPRWGQFVNQDLANYHVPVHADIPDLNAVFLPEVDERANPMGAKGVGELGICGAAAAVANAVYNACGVRVREYPITIDRLLPRLLKV